MHYLGYSDVQQGFRCYDPVAKRVRISHHVTFLEFVPFFFLAVTLFLSLSHISRLSLSNVGKMPWLRS